jgi:hypothetical protein
LQEEGFDEDEGIYDDLNLDEEEEKFGLAADDDDSEDSDVNSEGGLVDLTPAPILTPRYRCTSTTVCKENRRRERIK